MRRKILNIMVLTLVVCFFPCARPLTAQEEKPGNVSKDTVLPPKAKSSDAYRVEYSVRELEDGKKINSRSYKLLVQKDEWQRIRVGSRVPYLAGEKQIQYADVGINIDCRVTEARERDVTLHSVFDSSSLAREERVVGEGVSNPVFRHVRAESATPIVLGKPTVIDVVEDVISSHQYEIEVTVTNVK